MTEQNSRPRAFWAGWIAAGVMLLVAAVAGVYAANLKIQLDDVELRLVDAVTKLQMSEERLVGAATESSSIRANLSVLSAADTVILKLVGKEPAAEATGRAFTSPTKGLLFSAAKLPRLQDGQGYQLWFLTRTGPVNAGVVHASEDGNVTAAFDPLTDAQAVTGFSVTLESENGSPSPTGAVYLTTQ